MNRSLVQTLILKDLRLHRMIILLSIAGGIIALGILQVKTEAAFLIGAIWFFVSLIVLGSMLPVSNVINERKKQNLAFLMSLPISALQYAMAKMLSTIGIFLVPWTALLLAGSTFILSRRDIPNGSFPLMLILMFLPFLGFCIIAGTALISESEGCTIAATIICNTSYSLAWYFIIRRPAINGALKSSVPIWNSSVLTILGGEAAAIVLILALTFYLQSRKRSFV